MSHITQANQGLKALDDRKWNEAVDLLSKALLVSTNPAWLLARSRALVGLKRHEEALEDANLGFHVAFDRSKRELLTEAHYRRAVAHFRLGQYANGDCCCVYAMRLCRDLPAIEKEDPKLAYLDEHGFWTATLQKAKREAAEDPFNASPSSLFENEHPAKAPACVNAWRRASTMRQQCLGAMEKLPADDAARKITISLRPERKSLVDLTTDGGRDGAVNAAPAPPQAQPAKTLVVQDYQTNDTMTVSIFSRGVDQARLRVEFLPDHVRLSPIVYPDGEEKEWTLRPYSQIDPAASSYHVTPKKVELRLAKKPAGKWPRLRKDESVDQGAEDARQDIPNVLQAATPKTAAPPPDVHAADKDAARKSQEEAAGPAYPTSARTGPKNWDKIAADDDADDAGGVEDFFRKLYGTGTDDQKRAMMKSFMESNGTTLSTDWLDVGSRTVGTNPPEGVEAKKW
ncbi:hypothetical protein E4U42_004332 [Claviceps africana]|uniref:SGT1 protein n=1 Tax=Claviceps africana TaxID=83212 RepID=A0A8K0NI56_9HYPO|nr:hypothetical protein E4U42_004332 [Claviceps africana]